VWSLQKRISKDAIPVFRSTAPQTPNSRIIHLKIKLMNIKKTRENLLFSIEKLKSWKKVLLDKHKEDSDEFVMLMEVMTQCVNCLSNVTSVCEKSYDYHFANKIDIAELDRQANEYIELVVRM
jgi:hypothetical protein